MQVSKSDFDYIRKLVLDNSAIVLEEGKEYLVESRIGPVAKAEGFETIDQLVEDGKLTLDRSVNQRDDQKNRDCRQKQPHACRNRDGGNLYR